MRIMGCVSQAYCQLNGVSLRRMEEEKALALQAEFIERWEKETGEDLGSFNKSVGIALRFFRDKHGMFVFDSKVFISDAEALGFFIALHVKKAEVRTFLNDIGNLKSGLDLIHKSREEKKGYEEQLANLSEQKQGWVSSLFFNKEKKIEELKGIIKSKEIELENSLKAEKEILDMVSFEEKYFKERFEEVKSRKDWRDSFFG